MLYVWLMAMSSTVLCDPYCHTCDRVIEQELHKNAAVITKVSETASKEFAIESALDKMQGAWVVVRLVIEDYRETGMCERKGAQFTSEGTRENVCLLFKQGRAARCTWS